MKVVDFPGESRAPEAVPAGASKVADLRAMPGNQALAVMFFRDWCSGCRSSVEKALVESLGFERGGATVAALDEFMELLAHQGRRPVRYHDLHCVCVGADEAVIANLLHLAATGEREDAMLVASLLLPGETLSIAVEAARIAGLGIMRTKVRETKPRHQNALH